jgi:hypothetical protein
VVEQPVGQSGEPVQAYGLQLGEPAEPLGTGAQVPGWPAWLQVSQPPLQAESQQVESAQWPLAHSESVLQGAPAGFEPRQLPPEQVAPDWHWAAVVQLEAQLPSAEQR